MLDRVQPGHRFRTWHEIFAHANTADISVPKSTIDNEKWVFPAWFGTLLAPDRYKRVMADSDTSSSSITKQPKRRVSWFAWLVTVIVACCLVVMNSRGRLDHGSVQFVRDSKTQSLEPTCRYAHGWPMKWVDSEPIDAPSGEPFDSDLNKLLSNYLSKRSPKLDKGWLFNTTPTSISYTALSINSLVALLILVGVFFVFKFRSRRQRWFKFSLLEVAITTILVSFALANYQMHRSLSNEESRIIAESKGTIKAEYRWNGPMVLQSLLGELEWMNVYRHVDHLELINEIRLKENVRLSGLNLEEMFHEDQEVVPLEQLGVFTYATSVKITGTANVNLIESIAEIKGLESIEIDFTFTGMWRSKYFASNNSIIEVPSERMEWPESRESRKIRPDVMFPSVTRLSIDSKVSGVGDNWSDWSHSLDLASRCPSLKELSLAEKEFIIEDFMNLTAAIESIQHADCLSEEEAEALREKFPNAVITNTRPDAARLSKEDRSPWRSAKIRINRRRKGAEAGLFAQKGVLDLSSMELDREFLETLSPVFPTTESIIFGSFDSPETITWLMRQCPNLAVVNTQSFPFCFDQAMQLPTSVRSLVIDQGEITVDEFAKLISHLQLERIRIESVKFERHEVEKIRQSNPGCVVKLSTRKRK